MLTQEELKELLHYDPETGVFTNRINRGRARVGKECGSYVSGYLVASIEGKNYRLHRLAFLYMEGYLPEHEVDHLNGIRDDNRWCNLRHVSNACNSQNCKCYSTNKSGFYGVGWNKYRGGWKARAMVGGKDIHLGYYSSPLEAALARLTWEVQSPDWHCNSRGILVQQIQSAWPQFNTRSLV